MTHQIFKIFVKETGFMGAFNYLLGPHYFQYFFYALRQNIINNPHLFTLYEEEATIIITSNFNTDKIKYYEDKNHTIIDFNNSYFKDFDKSNVNVIKFNNMENQYMNAKVHSQYAPYDYHIYSSNSYEISQIPRYDSFNFSVFCDNISDISELIQFWNDNDYISGNLYCFYSDMSVETVDKIAKIKQPSESKKILFYNIERSKIDFILTVLKNSVFSLHYNHNLIYPFWSMRFKCYPIVLESDINSKYLSHIKSSNDFIKIIESFWFYRKELAKLIKSLDSIDVPKFNLSNIIMEN